MLILRKTFRWAASRSASSAKALFAVAIATLTLAAQAQVFGDSDWTESDAPPPPRFDMQRLVPIEMPAYMTLQFGVDPATIAITGDGVVRYVVVAHNRAGGGMNAFYEGVRCATEEYKTYARFSENAWDKVGEPEWKSINSRNSLYTKALALQALCRGHAPRASVQDMLLNLRQPIRKVQ